MKHESTRIYQTALALIDTAGVLMRRMPRGAHAMKDQLLRASSSVLLNFAEGCKHGSLDQRRTFFRAASGSASEVSAIFDIARRFDWVDEETCKAAKDKCDHLCAMLALFR